MKPKVVAIVQARMGSSRLPGKMLKLVQGKPVLLHMLERVRHSQTLDELWLATSDSSPDDLLADVVKGAGYKVFRGSEEDVLDRYYQLAKQREASVVVRLTGDCPLHDPTVIDQTVQMYLKVYPTYAYGSNVIPPTYPDGLDAEVFSFEALERAYQTCRDPREREHVTLGIHRHHHQGEKPPILNWRAPADFSHLRWTLDTAEDLSFIQAIYDQLYPKNPNFTWWEVLALLTLKPQLQLINRQFERNWTLEADLKAKPLEVSHE